MADPFIGEIRIFAGNFAPRDWAFCDGRLLQISSNPALFSLLGTTYGGDGRTTFGLPDLRGRAPMHDGNGPGLTPRRLGQKGGTQTVTLNANQLPLHRHFLQASFEDGDSLDPANQNVGTGNDMFAPAANLADMDGAALPPAGGSQPHNNLQPFLTMNFIISLAGRFPSRS